MANEIDVRNNKTYLGDSVYARIDESRGITLTTESGSPLDPSNEIYLEPEVYKALISCVKHIEKKEVRE